MSQYPDLSRLSAPVTSYDNASSHKETETRAGNEERVPGAPELTRASLTAYLEKRSPNLARSSVARAEEELIQRPIHHLACNVTLTIKDVQAGHNVYYKFDGKRFSGSDATIKVITGATYELTVLVKPHMDIANNLLYLRSMAHDVAAKQQVVSLSKSRVDGRTISGSWKCDLEPNKKNERFTFEISGKLTHFGDFTIPLLLKVYHADSRGALQGFRLKVIAFELKRQQEDDTKAANLSSIRYIS